MPISLSTIGASQKRSRIPQSFFLNATYGTTIPSHQAGDIIIGGAWVSQGSQFNPIDPTPATPSGWTSIDTDYFSNGPGPFSIYGNFGSRLIAKIATDSLTTGFTGGQNAAYVVYRGPTGFGNGQTLLTSVNYGIISPLQQTNGSSIVVGFVPSGGLIPSIGIERFNQVVNGQTVKVWDTGTGVSSFNTAYPVSSPSGADSAVIELTF